MNRTRAKTSSSMPKMKPFNILKFAQLGTTVRNGTCNMRFQKCHSITGVKNPRKIDYNYLTYHNNIKLTENNKIKQL